jgi:anti-anti-sigma factor
MTVILKMYPKSTHIVHVEDPLRTPISQALCHKVRELLRRGERRIVLDMSAVSRIDAGGVGELVRALNMTTDHNGILRIANTTRWVRQLLEHAHLFDLLGGKAEVRQRLA